MIHGNLQDDEKAVKFWGEAKLVTLMGHECVQIEGVESSFLEHFFFLVHFFHFDCSVDEMSSFLSNVTGSILSLSQNKCQFHGSVWNRCKK